MLHCSDMDYSLMQLYAQPNKILPVIAPPVLFPNPVRVLPNRPDGDLLTGTVPMKAERIEIPVPEIRNVSLGDSLAGIEDGVVAEDVAPIPVSLSQEATSNINDNYLFGPTLRKTIVAKLDERTVTRTVKPKVVQFSVRFTQSSDDIKFKSSKCILSCCQSCSFCLFPWATTKERYKSLYSKERWK